MRATGQIALALGIAGGFYLLLIDTTSAPELYAGAGATLLAVAAGVLSGIGRRSSSTGAGDRDSAASWPSVIGKGLLQIPRDAVLVSREAIAQLFEREPVRGRFIATPLPRHAARDAGTRAIHEAAGSLAPNTIVLGVDDTREQVVAHRLHEAGSGSRRARSGRR